MLMVKIKHVENIFKAFNLRNSNYPFQKITQFIFFCKLEQVNYFTRKKFKIVAIAIVSCLLKKLMSHQINFDQTENKRYFIL